MKSILFLLITGLFQIGPVFGGDVPEKKNEILILRFDGRSITLNSKDEADYAICHKMIKMVVEIRGLAGLRVEHGFGMDAEGNKFSWESVPVVGEKKGGYYRFLHTELQQAVVATENLDEAIHRCLERFKIVPTAEVKANMKQPAQQEAAGQSATDE